MVYITRGSSCITEASAWVYFFEKSFLRAKIVPKVVMEIVKSLPVPFESFHMLYGFFVNSKIGVHELLRIMRF